MASEYYLQRAGQEVGPFAFRDLVALAREGNLADSDLVRYSWTNEWKRADSLVGLFHMAQRTPEALADPSPVPPVAVESVTQIEPGAEPNASDVDDRPGWMKRLLSIGSRHKKPMEIPILGPRAPELPSAAAMCEPTPDVMPVCESALLENTTDLADPCQAPDLASEVAGPALPNTEVFRNNWSSTVDEALSSMTARQSACHPHLRQGRWRKLFGRLSKILPGNGRGDARLRVGYRIVSTIVFATIMAVSVESWSQEEGGRFLRGHSQKATMRLFPVLGKCSTGKYVFLMADLVLATGAVTWFAAGWLESHAE
jgi:hypothetical protein